MLTLKSSTTIKSMRIHIRRNNRANQAEQRVLSNIQANTLVFPAEIRIRWLH